RGRRCAPRSATREPRPAALRRGLGGGGLGLEVLDRLGVHRLLADALRWLERAVELLEEAVLDDGDHAGRAGRERLLDLLLHLAAVVAVLGLADHTPGL